MINLIFGLLIQASIATPLTPAEANRISFEDCLSEESIEINWEDGNTVVIAIFCGAANILEQKVTIISGHRPNSKGQHKFENAYDGYFEFPEDECIWSSYRGHILVVMMIIASLGLEDKSGLGIYFRDEDGNGSQLSIHVDIRGYRARWSFIGDDQLPFEAGELHLKDLIKEECEE